MRNVILWGIQVTVDYTYDVGGELTQIAREWADKDESRRILPQCYDFLKSIATSGLARDDRLNLKDDPKSERMADELRKARKYLDDNGYERRAQIGGNPAISGIRGYYLRVGAEGSTLPAVFYAGLYPRSVDEFLEENPGLRGVFRGRFPVDEWPQTVALEAERKLILVHGPGRTADYLATEGRFDRYLQLISDVVVDYPDGVAVIALSIPWPLDLGSRMIKEFRGRFEDKVKIFVGTSSFRDAEGRLNVERTREIYEKILEQADIVSCNETELDDLHTVIVGDGAYQDISLANKLKDLPLEAIKVCHSADGAILDIGCNPEAIINSGKFRDDPHEYLREALQLSVDGATCAIDAVKVGRTANESVIKIYSGSITDRSTELFRVTFLKTVERLPGGIVAVQAPLVVQRRAALTGVGAIFDGLLLSFLMRD